MNAGDIIPSRIEACEAHAYHISGHIQPHGILLAFDPSTWRIVRLSSNAAAILGGASSQILGSALSTWIAPESVRRLERMLEAHGGKPVFKRAGLVVTLADARRTFTDAFLYRSGRLFCLELEQPQADNPGPDAAELSSDFFDMIERIGGAHVPSARLAGITCDAIREVTGFDRVCFCRFDRHGHGHVLAESGIGVLPGLLDHRFPASDVPRAARQIYVVNPYRMIPDVDAEPVAILQERQGESGGEAATPMDLTLSSCRAIAPTHLQYLRNMGVAASLSFSVAAEDTLQAIFGGHHATPRRVSYQRLAACQHLVELYKTRVRFLKIGEERTLIKDRVDALYAISASFSLAEGDLGRFIAANHDRFRDLMHADDVLCRFEGESHLGCTLAPWDANSLLDFVARKLTPGVGHFETDCIGEADAAFAALRPTVAGLLAVTLDLAGKNILVWLRAETIVSECWSGNPHQAVTYDARGAVGPRTSFAAYVRETHGTCREWSSALINLALQSRHAFSQVLAAQYEAGMRAAAERAHALKSDFIATISHELRSPLHAILGMSSVLQAADEALPHDKRRRFASTINASGERLLRLIDDLLDLSKLEAGKMSFEFAAADMVRTLDQSVDAIAALAAAKNVDIVRLNRRDQAMCRHDAGRMQQVMINLLSNAIRFSSAGECVTVTLDISEPGPAGALVLVEVADQGAGIPDGEFEAIFEKFVQSSRTRSGAGGTGLGLTICREIVEAHRGRIWALNNRAGGASLFISLPALSGPDPKDAA